MPPRGPAIAEFLRDALAGNEVDVPKLEAMARGAGLLGENQRITNAKAAQYSLAVRSCVMLSLRGACADDIVRIAALLTTSLVTAVRPLPHAGRRADTFEFRVHRGRCRATPCRPDRR